MANHFAHIELTTPRTKEAQEFYKKIFKWKFKPTKGMPYTMLDTGPKGIGGGVTEPMMPEAPTAWMPYVEVDDVKATLSKAESNGARVVVPYQEIGAMGSIGVFVDPTGAALGIWAMQKKPAKRKPAAKKKAGKKKRK